MPIIEQRDRDLDLARRIQAKEPMGPSPFNQDAFGLLAGIENQPNQAFYQAHKSQFKTHLENPFKQFLKSALAALPDAMHAELETERHLFGRFLKNDFGRGGAWDHFWGAAYFRGCRRAKSPQLFCSIYAHEVTFGFYIHEKNPKAAVFLERFQRNQAEILASLGSFFNQPGFRFGYASSPAAGFDAWRHMPEKWGIRVAKVESPETVMALSLEEVRQQVVEMFQRCYAFMALTRTKDPAG